MTKEEAIKYLQQLYPYGGHCWLNEKRIEDVGMAIKALQEEPVSKDYRERYKRIAQSKEFKKTYEGMSVGEIMHVEVEEPVGNDFEMALAEMIHNAQTSVVEPLVVAAQWKDELIKLAKSEEPVSEDLEEASKEWLRPQLDKSYVNYGEVKMMELTHFDGYAMLDAIEFGAQWQKEKDSILPMDLGEYINELSKQFPEVSFAKLSRIAVRVSRWQRNQDVKNKLPKVISRTDLDEYAYQCAYDMSNDWAIENPTWKDVEDACKLGAQWQKEQLEKNRLKHCNSITNEQAELEQGFIDKHLDKHQRMPTFLDAIEYGMRLQEEQIEEALLSEILPCFMHGGEADEVVAKLDEVLNKKK